MKNKQTNKQTKTVIINKIHIYTLIIVKLIYTSTRRKDLQIKKNNNVGTTFWKLRARCHDEMLMSPSLLEKIYNSMHVKDNLQHLVRRGC